MMLVAAAVATGGATDEVESSYFLFFACRKRHVKLDEESMKGVSLV